MTDRERKIQGMREGSWEIMIDDLNGALAMVPTENAAAKIEVVEAKALDMAMDLVKAKDLEWQAKVQGLVEALRFYAKHENWEVSAIGDQLVVKTKLTKDKESFGEVEKPGAASKLTFYGGKLAREALAAFKNETASNCS